MVEYHTLSTDAVTGEVTIIPWTEEEIAARKARIAALGLDKPKVPDTITRRQCALQLLAMKVITPQEAKAMVKSAELPAAISSILDAQVANGAMTPDQHVLAEIDFAAANYYRNNQLLSLMGMTSEQIDQFFIAASLL